MRRGIELRGEEGRIQCYSRREIWREKNGGHMLEEGC